MLNSWKTFIIGFLAATVIATTGAIWLTVRFENQPFRLPPKIFVDSGEVPSGKSYVHFEGTIGGDEPMANPDNIFAGTCRQERKTCETNDVAMLGPNHLGSINSDTYEITRWTPELIVAENGFPECASIKLIILRIEKIVQYVRIPKNPPSNSALCKHTERRSITWTIGNPRS